LYEETPRLIVNAAAYNAVDRAEEETGEAWRINARLPALLGDVARDLAARVVHYSTDYVFDGAGGAPYAEGAVAIPLNAYGRSKLEGEERLLAVGADALVIRTSWVIGPVGDNFARRILRLAATRDELSIVTDEISAPTNSLDLAAATAKLVGRADVGAWGGTPRLHLAGGGAATRFEYAAFVLGVAEAAGMRLRVPAAALQPTTAAAFNAAARRPTDSRLDCGLAARRFGITLPHWRTAVGALLPEIVASSVADSQG
jgi:dTDP-4-dehydrorhamnose reductase